MKNLRFKHSCHLQMDATVVSHYFTLRVVPRDDPAQSISLEECALEPAVPYVTQEDGHGNLLQVGHCLEGHRAFSYRVSGSARVDAARGRGTGLNVAYRFPSPLTQAGPALAALHAQAPAFSTREAQGTAAFERARQLCALVYANMEYDPQATSVATTAEQAAEMGRGVCQDYAHLLCHLLRADGIPARYVSGLMWGEGATHAWVEFYDGATWWGLDPTNDCEAGDYYIVLARGRDHADCPLESGVFRGNAAQEQHVSACVEVVE